MLLIPTCKIDIISDFKAEHFEPHEQKQVAITEANMMKQILRMIDYIKAHNNKTPMKN